MEKKEFLVKIQLLSKEYIMRLIKRLFPVLGSKLFVLFLFTMCDSGLRPSLQIYYPFGEIRFFDSFSITQEEIYPQYIDDNYSQGVYKQYFSHFDTIISTHKVNVDLILGYKSEKLMFFSYKISASSQESKDSILSSIMEGINEYINESNWQIAGSQEYRTLDDKFEFTYFTPKIKNTVIEVNFTYCDWPLK